VGEDDAAVAEDFVGDADVLTEHGHVLDAGPLADGAVPADDAAGDAGVLLDAHAAHDGAAREAHAGLDHAALPDGHVRPDQAPVAHRRRLVHDHVAQERVPRREPLRGLLPERGQVQAQARVVVPRLADVHPEPRQHHRVQPPLRGDLRKHLLLDRRRPQLNPVQRPRAQEVYPRVDLVAHKLLRLLHKPLHAPARLVHHHHAILRRLVDLTRKKPTLLTWLDRKRISHVKE
jgi:hypothetical protein